MFIHLQLQAPPSNGNVINEDIVENVNYAEVNGEEAEVKEATGMMVLIKLMSSIFN